MHSPLAAISTSLQSRKLIAFIRRTRSRVVTLLTSRRSRPRSPVEAGEEERDEGAWAKDDMDDVEVKVGEGGRSSCEEEREEALADEAPDSKEGEVRVKRS